LGGRDERCRAIGRRNGDAGQWQPQYHESGREQAGQLGRRIEFLGERAARKAYVDIMVSGFQAAVGMMRTIFHRMERCGRLASIEAQVQVGRVDRHGQNRDRNDRNPKAQEDRGTSHGVSIASSPKPDQPLMGRIG
jgi:hypothetical protein